MSESQGTESNDVTELSYLSDPAYESKVTEEELVDFTFNKLDASQMEFIRGEIIKSPDLRRRWKEIRDCKQKVALASKSSAPYRPTIWDSLHRALNFKWQPPVIWGASIAGAFSVALVIVLSIGTMPLDQQVDDLYASVGEKTVTVFPHIESTEYFTKSISKPKFEYHNVVAGIRSGITTVATNVDDWQYVLGDLPENIKCTADDCSAEENAFQLGRYLAISYINCVGGQVDVTDGLLNEFEMSELSLPNFDFKALSFCEKVNKSLEFYMQSTP